MTRSNSEIQAGIDLQTSDAVVKFIERHFCLMQDLQKFNFIQSNEEWLQRLCQVMKDSELYRSVIAVNMNKQGGIVNAFETGVGSIFYRFRSYFSYRDYPPCIRMAYTSCEMIVILPNREICGSCPMFPIHRATQVLCKRMEFEHIITGMLVVSSDIGPDLEIIDQTRRSAFDQICNMASLRTFTRLLHIDYKEAMTQYITFPKEHALLQEPYMTINSRFQIIAVNQGVEILLGANRKELISKNLKEIMISPDIAQFREYIKSSNRAGTMAVGRMTIKKPDESILECEYRIFSMAITKGEIGTLLCMLKEESPGKLRNREIIQAEQTLRSIVDGINDVVFEVDPAGDIIKINRAIEQVLQYHPPELQGMNFMKLVHPEDRVRVLDNFQSLVSGYPFLHEFKMIAKGASDRHVQVSMQPLTKGANTIGFFGVLTDKTDQWNHHQRIKELTSLLDNIIDQANIWIEFVRLPSEKILIWNKTAEKLSGYTIHEVPTYSDLLKKIYPSRPYRYKVKGLRSSQVTESNSFQNFETSITSKSGSKFIIQWSHKTLFDKLGFPVGIIGIGSDITEEVKIRQQLSESEQKFRSLAENSPDIIARFDVRGNLIYINEACQKLTGQDLTPYLAKAIDRIDLPVIEREKVREVLKSTIRTGVSSEQDFEYKLDKELMIFNWRLTPEKSSDGRVHSVLAIIRDVTSERRMERQIRHMQKMQAIGQLAGGIAHDFNNQLSAIIGLAEILQRHLSREPALRQYAEMILKASNRSADLTSQLLAFSRRSGIHAVPVDLHRIIQEVISLLKHSIGKTIRIKQELRASHSVIIGDPTQIQNALLNLAINSRDAMPDGGDLVFSTQDAILDRTACRKLSYPVRPGKYLQINVSDTGQGMSEDTKEHLFEPFFTTKTEKNGTGMGLVAVYGTLKAHEGGLNLSSQPGKGTVFNLYFPCHTITPQEKVEVAAELSASGGARILVIDDEDVVGQTTREILVSLGYQTCFINDGQNAIEHFKKNKDQYDLVILDVEMPGMLGWDIFKELKKINPEIRCLFCSGYCIENQAQQIKDEGVCGFLQKPFRMSEISKVVSILLNS